MPSYDDWNTLVTGNFCYETASAQSTQYINVAALLNMPHTGVGLAHQDHGHSLSDWWLLSRGAPRTYLRSIPAA